MVIENTCWGHSTIDLFLSHAGYQVQNFTNESIYKYVLKIILFNHKRKVIL